MTVLAKRAEIRDSRDGDRLSISDLVLLRVAAGGAIRADLQRDLAQLVAPSVPGVEFRRSAELAISAHLGCNLLIENRGRLTATPAGARKATLIAGPAKGSYASWADARNGLAIRALGVSPTPAALKAMQRPESLAALALQRHFALPASRALSPTDLRAALAIVALERAFGGRIKTGLAKGSGLPAKAGRLLAAQLFKNPREFASDGKLALALAAEILGAHETSLEALKTALIKRLTDARETPAPGEAKVSPRKSRPPRPDNDATPLPSGEPQLAPSPPDMAEFRAAVMAAARPVSEGWPGNRKAFISLVWNAIRHARPDWGLSEIAFKGMLAEAHRCGQLELVGADLKEGRDLKALEESRILYKNTVWHFVRVED